jgi:hypothetical protein
VGGKLADRFWTKKLQRRQNACHRRCCRRLEPNAHERILKMPLILSSFSKIECRKEKTKRMKLQKLSEILLPTKITKDPFFSAHW